MKRFSVLATLSALLVSLIGYGVYWHAGGPEPAEVSPYDPTPRPDRIVLTWGDDPATTQSVTWRTDTTVTDAVAQIALATPSPMFTQHARTAEADTETLDAPHIDGIESVAKYHSVTFSGLAPDTLYAYRVGDGETWSEWFQFRTASQKPEPFSFIYLGDAQNNVRSLWSRTLRASYGAAPEARFVIHSGDLVNRAHRDSEWGEWFEAGGWLHATVPAIPVPGNHEYGGFEIVRDTLSISATLSGSEMDGAITFPDGRSLPLQAERTDSTTSEARPAGSWTFGLGPSGDEYRGRLNIERASGNLGGVLIGSDTKERPLKNVRMNDGTFTADFVMDLGSEGEEHLSTQWRPQFTLPTHGPEGLEETTYYIDYQGVRVVGLNSDALLNSSKQARERQLKWLKDVLSDDQSRWTIVTFHHPMFSPSEDRDYRPLREFWKPIIDEYQVDLVLQGHDHTYARGRPHNEQRKTEGKTARDGKSNTVYVVSVSGPKMYDLKEDRWETYDGAEMERAAENTQLYQVLRVDDDTLEFRAYTATNQLYDSFDLIKRGNKPNRFVAHMDSGESVRTHENTNR